MPSFVALTSFDGTLTFHCIPRANARVLEGRKTHAKHVQMNKFTILSNSELLKQIRALATTERETGIEILHRLREIEQRRAYAEAGYSSLFTFCVQDLKYSESSAWRRINAMRAMVELPEIEAAMQKGELNTATVSQVQSFFLAQEKKSGEIKQGEKLERIKDLTGHVEMDPSYAELFERMADVVLKKIDPEKKVKKTEPQEEVLSPGKEAAQQSKSPDYISVATRTQVWIESKSRCCYIDPKSGRRCAETRALEMDHVIPKALGGANTVENLRLLCPAHNQLAAIQTFGVHKMRQYVPDIA